MSQLAPSASFDYLCYGSTTITNMFTIEVWGFYRRQILTSKVDPRAVRVK